MSGRDDDHGQLDHGGLSRPVAVVAAAAEAAEEPGVEREPGDEAGHHPEEAGDGHDGHVAVGDVRQLVGQDGLELGLVEAAHDAPGGAHHGVRRVAPGGEGVGHVDVGDGHPGLLHVGEGAEPVDDAVELGLLLGGDDVPVHAEEGDLVREPVLAEQEGRGDDEDHAEVEADGEEDADDQGVEKDHEAVR